jgi:hypothetical protein
VRRLADAIHQPRTEVIRDFGQFVGKLAKEME